LIDFLELDIGGIETQVLLECEDRLKNVKKILVRYYSLVGQSQPLHILLELLMRNGFRYNMNAIDPPEHPFIKEERDAKIYLGADERLDIMGTR